MSKTPTESTQSTSSTHSAPNGSSAQAGAQSAQSAQAGAARAKAPWEIPFAMPMPDVFAQMVRDQITRTQAVMGELALYEGVAVQRARTAVDDLARLTNDSIGYVGQLAAEWRKLSLETMQRTVDAFAPRA